MTEQPSAAPIADPLPERSLHAPVARELPVDLERELSSVDGSRRWLRRGLVLLAVAALVTFALVWRAKHRPPPPARYLAQMLTRGDVTETVQSTGTVKATTEVQVGAQVSGRITRVFVDFNSNVKRGDVLAEMDPLTYGAQVRQQAAQKSAGQAALVRARANAETLRVALDRTTKLRDAHLASQSDVDTAKGQYDVAMAQVTESQADIDATSAALAAAGANLSYTRIYAPIDGVITNRAIDPGQTVAASFQAPVLFTIDEDLRKMRVFADIDEADVGKLREGMNAEATVDAFPGERFNGLVSQVRYSPTTVQGVVTYQAVIEVDNADRKLRPGMTATVTVRTNEAKGVVRVPNAALRYKPSPEKGPDGKPLPKAPEKALEAHTGRIYVLTDDKPGAEKVEARVVTIGITDGTQTELREPDLAPGVKVVADETDDKDAQKKGPRLF